MFMERKHWTPKVLLFFKLRKMKFLFLWWSRLVKIIGHWYLSGYLIIALRFVDLGSNADKGND